MSVTFIPPLCPLLAGPPTAEQLAAWVRLALQPGLTATSRRHLLQLAGSPEAVADLPAGQVQAIAGSTALALLAARPAADVQQEIDQTLRWAGQPGHRLLVYAEPDYPPGLRQLHDPPLVLFVRGSLAPLQQRSVALVGSRMASAAGLELAHAFARELAEAGWSIVSGLARGIDTAAHRGALAAENGAGTVAIMANGVDRVYPPGNLGLAQRIAETGAVTSELPLGTASIAWQFPRRNRLVAALARGVVVIEAAARSGSLITARLAAELGREVFAVPGSVHAAQVKGCHILIREGAQLVESAAEVQAALNVEPRLPLAEAACHWRQLRLDDLDERAATSQSETNSVLPGSVLLGSAQPLPAVLPPWLTTDVAMALHAALGYDPAALDDLLARTGLSSSVVQAGLLALELAGVTRRLPDGRWERAGSR